MRSLALAIALLLIAPAAAHARDATITSFDGTQIVLSFHPSPNGGKAPTILEGHGWGGSRQTDPNAASDEATGNVGVGPLRKAGFNVLTWDARGFGNSGGTVTVDAPDKEARDVMALIDWLAHAARGAARQGRRPARGHDRRLLRGRDRAHHRRAGQAHRRDRPDHRLALAADLAVQGGDGQGRLGDRALRRRRGGLQGPPGPARHVRVRLRRHHRQAERGGPRLVRQPRPGRPRQADHGPDVRRRGHRGHAVHARRGDHQLRDPQGQRRPGQDDVVLRRPRRLPHRRRPARPHRGRGGRVAEALRGPGRERRHRPALRVAGRRRPVALGARLPGRARRSGHRHRLRHAAC